VVIKHILTPGEKRRLARNRRIVRRRREGLDAAELARRFRMTPAAIHWILRAHQRSTGENICRLPRKPQQRPEREVPDLSPLRKGRLARNCHIVSLRREGHEVRELARRYRLTPSSIYRILQDHAHATGENLGRLSRKLRPRPEHGAAPLTSLQKHRLPRDRKIVRLRRKGQDVAELARRFEVTQQTIRKILKSHAQATGEYLGQLPRKPHHFCPNCDGPVFSRKTKFCSRTCYLAPVCKKRVAEAKQVISLRLDGRTWPEIEAAPGFRTVHVTAWLKENRVAFELTEAEWQRVFPGSGRRRHQARPQHGAAGAGAGTPPAVLSGRGR
jgi:Mor family transcriptional regulator